MILIMFIVTLFFASFNALSQHADTVQLFDGDKIIVSIQEIEGSFIKYKKLNNTEGPTYKLTSDDISHIILANGDKISNINGELTSKDPNLITKKTDPTPIYKNLDPFYDENKENRKSSRVTRSILYNSRKNLIGFNYSSFITLDLEFSYERIIDKVGYFGLKVPIKFNMGIKPRYLNKHNIFTSGVHCNIYPLGQGRVTYFTGPAFQIKIMADNDEFVTGGNNAVSITIDPVRSTYLGFYMNNGCLLRASPFLYFGVAAGFGFRKDLARSTENSIFEVIGEASISFRFK